MLMRLEPVKNENNMLLCEKIIINTLIICKCKENIVQHTRTAARCVQVTRAAQAYIQIYITAAVGISWKTCA